MTAFTSAVLATSTVQAVGTVLAILIVLALIVYAVFNISAGRAEVGSELELAANRKPYLDDEELETKKLDRTLTYGLIGLVVVGVGLPAYWLAEPGRQDGAIEKWEHTAEKRGEGLYVEGAGCDACHGPDGIGGSTTEVITDGDGEFVAQVNYLAPALNTALHRYDVDELFFILDHGRDFSPMPPWGPDGGGPFIEQQLDNLIAYLAAIQISPEEARAEIEDELRRDLGLGENDPIDYDSLETGEALFNLGRESGFAGGAYSCARCHTRGWSMDPASAQPEGVDLSVYLDYPDGSGAFGPRLRDGIVPRQFASIEDLIEFITEGGENGVGYGQSGLSSGMMPGFGNDPNTEAPDDGMYSAEMIEAVARYVVSLGAPDARADDDDNDTDQG